MHKWVAFAGANTWPTGLSLSDSLVIVRTVCSLMGGERHAADPSERSYLRQRTRFDRNRRLPNEHGCAPDLPCPLGQRDAISGLSRLAVEVGSSADPRGVARRQHRSPSRDYPAMLRTVPEIRFGAMRYAESRPKCEFFLLPLSAEYFHGPIPSRVKMIAQALGHHEVVTMSGAIDFAKLLGEQANGLLDRTCFPCVRGCKGVAIMISSSAGDGYGCDSRVV